MFLLPAPCSLHLTPLLLFSFTPLLPALFSPPSPQDFPYREDGFLLWSALHHYVEGVVEAEYPTDEAVQGDGRSEARPISY